MLVLKVKMVREEWIMDFLCLDFLNSDWRDWRGTGRREDRLDKPAWVEQFLRQWGLEAPVPPDPAARLSLGELRDRMRSMVEALAAGRPFDDADVEALNRALEQVPFHSRLVRTEEGYRLQQVASAQGWPLVIGRIAASFAELLSGEDVRRIKICDNDDCRWIFFDESRNRTRRWCDDRMCGNLMKVRRFRARQQTKKGDG
jgi:predicted RNA-binding Zn ribbon-like protein